VEGFSQCPKRSPNMLRISTQQRPGEVHRDQPVRANVVAISTMG